MKNITIAFYVISLLAFNISNAQVTYTSTGSGNWISAATWGGAVPTSGSGVGSENIIIIEAGHIITVRGDGGGCSIGAEPEISLSNVVIYVRGTLRMRTKDHSCLGVPLTDFANVNFNGDSSGMFIESGGMVDSDGWANSMTQDNNWLSPVWSDLVNGDVTGPVTVGASPNNPLPIELLSWTIEQTNGGFIALWSTATEINNDYFTIEESIDGQQFYGIANIKTDNPNSLEFKSYSFPFEAISNEPVLYYRLKQTDLDGKFTYSDIVAITQVSSIASDEIWVYPNPIEGQQFVVYSPNKVIENLRLTSIGFNEIQLREEIQIDGSIKVSLPEDTNPGIYIITIDTQNARIQKRLTLSK